MDSERSQWEPVEAAWTRLRRHLDRANSFWLAFLFANDLRGVDTLAKRARWNREQRAARFLRITPANPVELAHLVDRLDADAPGPPGCTWVEAVHVGKDLIGGGSWTDAWTTCLQELNHRRDTLRRRLGGLVIVAPPAAKRLAMTVSTDLWSVRDYLSELEPTMLETGEAVSGQTLEPADERTRSGLDVPPLGGLPMDAGRSEMRQDEWTVLLAASDEDLTGSRSSRLETAIDSARAAGDGDVAGLLLLRRGTARMLADPAGARDDLAQAAHEARNDHVRFG